MLKHYLDWRGISRDLNRHTFSSQTHEHITVSCIEEIYKKYVAEAREQHPEMFLQSKYTPHTMRHTTATHMLEAGVPLMAIKNFLGHASVATTESNSISNQEDICQGYFHPKNAMFPFP